MVRETIAGRRAAARRALAVVAANITLAADPPVVIMDADFWQRAFQAVHRTLRLLVRTVPTVLLSAAIGVDAVKVQIFRLFRQRRVVFGIGWRKWIRQGQTCPDALGCSRHHRHAYLHRTKQNKKSIIFSSFFFQGFFVFLYKKKSVADCATWAPGEASCVGWFDQREKRRNFC